MKKNIRGQFPIGATNVMFDGEASILFVRKLNIKDLSVAFRNRRKVILRLP